MSNAYPASVLLCWALVGDGNGRRKDGLQGPGFRIIPNGQTYGPYIELSRFKMGVDPVGSNAEPNLYLQDRYGHPILYFKANSTANPQVAYVGYWTPQSQGPQPMYNLYDDQGSGNPARAGRGKPHRRATAVLRPTQ